MNPTARYCIMSYSHTASNAWGRWRPRICGTAGAVDRCRCDAV